MPTEASLGVASNSVKGEDLSGCFVAYIVKMIAAEGSSLAYIIELCDCRVTQSATPTAAVQKY